MAPVPPEMLCYPSAGAQGSPHWAAITLITVMNSKQSWIAKFALALLLTAVSPGSWAAEGTVVAQAAPAATTPDTQAAPPAATDSTYVIGPGDILQVFVWRQPELTVSVPVRPDGKVSTPLVEDIVAVGKTPSQLAREMEKVLSEYVRSPQVNVIVSQPISTLSQIKIIGQVARPQAIPYREGITALDAVLAVGGLAPFAAGNRAKIVRSENGKQREIKLKLDDLVNKGDMHQNLALKPGDVLVVPESRF